MAIKRIGVLTAGGDCPGLNAVIRAVVKSAIQEHGWEVVGFIDGFCGLVENWQLLLNEQAVSGILVRGGTILGTNNRANPFAYTLDENGKTCPAQDRSKDVLLNLKKSEVDALVVIGGDGTLSSAKKLMEIGVPLVGIPKTIDNDLNATDITFGFDTALTVATDAVDRLHSTAESHHRVMVVETMGRYAGWIALRAGIAGGGDIILIPEIPYDITGVIKAVENRESRGKEFTLIVVSEGAKTKDGTMVVQRKVEGSPEPLRLGGVSYQLADQLEKELDIETRVTILGHLQRGGIPTPFDRWLATRFGVKATQLVKSGEFGRMVSLSGTQIRSVPILEAIADLRRVDPKGDEVCAARSIGTSFGD